MENKIIVEKIKKDQLIPFNVSEEEIVSFALDESGILADDTLVNGLNGRELVKSFFQKRENFKQNSRLGHILIKEYNLSKESLIKALAKHEETEEPLGRCLVSLGLCTEEQIKLALETQAKMRSYIR